MNKRIRELAEQAGLKVNADGEIGPAFFGSVDTGYKKFAELIVFECANAVMDGTKEGDHYAQRIENHFDNGTGGILHFGVES